MPTRRLPAFALLVPALTLGCADPAPPADASPSPGASLEPVAEPTPALVPHAEDGPPKLSADSAIYEFGAITAKDTAEHVFTLHNTGGSDLHIDRVQAT
jgi:hypothetical protein